jgi:hypothetical protein
MKFLSLLNINLLLFFFSATLGAQSSSTDYIHPLNGGSTCDTSSHFSDSNHLPLVTMFGDSLGDFVDSDIHGVFGWNNYLSAVRADIPDWRVQNLAQAGNRTVNLYKEIQGCTRPIYRNDFKTSNHVAFEIGGNDAAAVSVVVRIMPWKVFSYYDPITNQKVTGVIDQLRQNIKSIIRYLRHPMLDKDVLVIGNFTALTTSPTLGEIGNYYDGFKKPLNDFYLKEKPEIDFDAITKPMVDLFIQNLAEVLQVTDPSDMITISNQPGKTSHLESVFKKFSNTMPDWYVNWLIATKDYQTVLSIILFMMQNPIAEVVAEENIETTNWVLNVKATTPAEDNTMVEVPNRKSPAPGKQFITFLPMYHNFVYWPDCAIGACYVGYPALFRDALPGHINAMGYFIWATVMADKIIDLDWHNDRIPRNGGLVWTPPNNPNLTIDPPLPPPTPVEEVVQPSPIDWVLIFCLLTGKCW